MGIGKTITGIALIVGTGVGSFYLGKSASDKEYGIKRDETGVYMEAKKAGKLYEIKTLEGQPYLKNESNFQLNVFKYELTDEITSIVTQKMSGSALEQKTATK
jgi:hypothetical protein